MKLFRILTIGFIILLVGTASAAPTIVVDNTVTVLSGHIFDYVVVIVMENHNANETYNCGSVCSYLTSLADDHAFSTNFRSTYNGSLTSYFALTMAKHNVPDRECSPDPQGPSSQPSYCPQDFKNIVDIIEGGGLTWKAYFEDYPFSCGNKCSPIGNCYVGYTGPGSYAGSHNSFVYYTDVVNNTDRCKRIVPANSVVDTANPETDDILLNDLKSPSTAPNFMWLMPNECDQMHHDCLGGVDPATQEVNQLTQGSKYLENMVPQILNSNIFLTQRAALFITFDECQNIITNNCTITDPITGQIHSTNRIYTLWASAHGSSVVQEKFKSNNFYNHYSFLHTLEWAWGLQSFTINDASAPIMKEFFPTSP